MRTITFKDLFHILRFPLPITHRISGMPDQNPSYKRKASLFCTPSTCMYIRYTCMNDGTESERFHHSEAMRVIVEEVKDLCYDHRDRYVCVRCPRKREG